MNTTTTVRANICNVTSGDTLLVDPSGAQVLVEVLRTEQVNHRAQTLVIVYRESDTGLTREWLVSFSLLVTFVV